MMYAKIAQCHHAITQKQWHMMTLEAFMSLTRNTVSYSEVSDQVLRDEFDDLWREQGGDIVDVHRRICLMLTETVQI